MAINSTQSQNLTKTGIIIIGSGFGGLAMAIQLKQANIHDFIILEKADQVGGTWRDNQYPGAACDVQSHLYSFSFAPKTDWSKRYADAPEIFNYINDLIDKFELKSHIKFAHEVRATRYDQKYQCWQTQLQNGVIFESQFIVLASGPLHIPQIPKIKGIEKFQGEVFHSSQWHHDYDLKNKNVASIGTGGSAIQYIPEIAPLVKQLYVFQRTAAWVIPRDERKYLALDQHLFKLSDAYRKFHRARLYWSNESRVIPIVKPQLMRVGQKIAEAYIRFQVKDRKLAKALTPNYVMGCKRILISNKYYPTFNRKNVSLISQGIQEMTSDSIIDQNGQRYPIDCLIYGTGFETDPRHYLKGFDCYGVDGIELKTAWKAGAESYYGICTTAFPNMFQLLGPNTLLGHNSVIFMIESQVKYIIQLMTWVQQSQAKAVMVKAQAQQDYNQGIQKQLKGTVWQSGCVSWYQQDGGKNFALWPTYTWKYWQDTRRFKATDFQLL